MQSGGFHHPQTRIFRLWILISLVWFSFFGFSFEFSCRRGLRRSLKRDSRNPRESPRKKWKNNFSRTHLFYWLAHGTALDAALRAFQFKKKSFKNICGKSQIVIFRIKFALCVAPAGGSNLESFQTFKNHAKIQISKSFCVPTHNLWGGTWFHFHASKRRENMMNIILHPRCGWG